MLIRGRNPRVGAPFFGVKRKIFLKINPMTPHL